MSERTIRLKTKILFGVGQMAESIKTTPFEIFLLFYYTQVLQLPGTLTGLAILIAMCVDAVTDPVVGTFADNLRSRWGRRHPLMYGSIVPFAASLYLVFSPPTDLGQAGLFVWLVLFAVLARTSITFFMVPYYAMGAELTSDYGERTSIVSYRTLFGTVSIGLVIVVAFSVFFAATPEFENGQLNPAAYPRFALALALGAIAVMLITSLGTHDQIRYLSQAKASGDAILPTVALRRLLTVLRNPSFRAIFVGSIIFFSMRGVSQGLGLHMGTYFWELTPKQLQLFNLSLVVGMIAGIPMVRPATRIFDKREVLLASVLLFIAATSIPPVLALAGLFPAPGTRELLFLLVAFTGFSGLAGGGMYVSSHSMLGDVADDHELRSRERAEGILFGCIFLAMKAASGLGHAVGGLCLDLIKFPKDAEPGMVAPDTVWNLGAVYGPVVAGMGVLSWLAYRGYRIDKTGHAETLRELKKSRAAAGATSRRGGRAMPAGSPDTA
jgi:Na+/melibiose symporter-like transporter